jgi:glycerophosphoryl diester phosphodiesterase
MNRAPDETRRGRASIPSAGVSRRGRHPRTLAAALVGLAVAAACGAPPGADESPTRLATSFDLQAHRGGAGLATEETLVAFGNALDLGVSTLELDAQVTKDLAVVVAHDPRVDRDLCRDTAPAQPGDPFFPYAGKPFAILTLAQVRTLDCGYQQDEAFPRQRVVRGARIAELADVFSLVRGRGAGDVWLNIELKTQADDLQVTQPRDVFARTVWQEVVAAGMESRVTIQSFDWASLAEIHEIEPDAPLVALSSPQRLEIGSSGPSPWLGGLDIDDFGGDVVRAAASVEGVVALSPSYDGHGSPVDAAMVAAGHGAGLRVIPWTVDDAEDMGRLIDLGVDGLITNYPDVLRRVMTERGLPLPTRHPAR